MIKDRLRLLFVGFCTALAMWTIYYTIKGDLNLRNFVYAFVTSSILAICIMFFSFSKFLIQKIESTIKHTPQEVTKCFAENNFELYNSKGNILFFIPKSKWRKFFFTGVEKIEVTLTDDKIVIKGYSNLLNKLNLSRLY